MKQQPDSEYTELFSYMGTKHLNISVAPKIGYNKCSRVVGGWLVLLASTNQNFAVGSKSFHSGISHSFQCGRGDEK
jgi:hypothetical protein